MRKKLIIPLVIGCIVILFFFFVSNSFVYLGSYTKVLCIGNKIISFKRNNRIILRKANIYRSSKKVKGYIKSNDDSFSYDYYGVSSHNDTINTGNSFIASGIFKKIDVVNIDSDQSISTDSLNAINEVLDLNLSLESIYDYKEIVYDLDNDSIEEKVIYVIYRLNDSVYTKISLIDDNMTYELVDYEETSDNEQIKSYDLKRLIDFNNDKKYEIVVSSNDGDSQPTYYNIYEYKNGEIKEIK